MQQPVDVLMGQPDWVIGGYGDVFEARAAEREAAQQKAKDRASKPSQPARPAARRRRR